MASMSDNDESRSRYFGDSSQIINWILDSGATCHMTTEVSGFIPGPLEDTYKHIEVVDRHHITENKQLQVRIKMCDDNGDTTYFWHQIYVIGYFNYYVNGFGTYLFIPLRFL